MEDHTAPAPPTLNYQLLFPFETQFDEHYGIIRCRTCNNPFYSKYAIQTHYNSNTTGCSHPPPSMWDKLIASLKFCLCLSENDIHKIQEADPTLPGAFVDGKTDNDERTRGATLRVRNPPSWVYKPLAKKLLDEFNLQGAFRAEIDDAYQFKKRISVVLKQAFVSFLKLIWTLIWTLIWKSIDWLWESREDIGIAVLYYIIVVKCISYIFYTFVLYDQVIVDIYNAIRRRLVYPKEYLDACREVYGTVEGCFDD